jgi:hypothetical protein
LSNRTVPPRLIEKLDQSMIALDEVWSMVSEEAEDLAMLAWPAAGRKRGRGRRCARDPDQRPQRQAEDGRIGYALPARPACPITHRVLLKMQDGCGPRPSDQARTSLPCGEASERYHPR